MRLISFLFHRIHAHMSGVAAVVFLLFITIVLPCAQAQSVTSTDRERGRTMLKEVKENIKKNYYDPTFHGVDLDARFNAADEKLKTATSLGQIFGIIAAAVADLNDSHTRFWPPALTTRTEYGWQMQMIGDKCYVVAVKPGSDAEAKGLKPGDQVISVDRIGPTRDILWKLNYLYYTLNPKRGMEVVVSRPDGQKFELQVMAKLTQVTVTQDLTDFDEFIKIVREIQSESKLTAHRYYENVDDVFIWKMPQFDLADNKVDEMMGKVKKRKALVLDLRGNGGGAEVTLLRLIGHFFDQDVKVGDLKTRKEAKPLTAKTRGNDAFKGKVVVLVDSESGSSAEVFARVMQLEKRGTVIGDHSAGAVMRSKYYSRKIGIDYVIFYGATITDADLLMTDGKSLEGLGVTPDTLILPIAKDLATLRDPVLALAASLAGAKMEPDKAGALFPIQWKK